MAYSKAKLKSSGDRASPALPLRMTGQGEMEEKYSTLYDYNVLGYDVV